MTNQYGNSSYNRNYGRNYNQNDSFSKPQRPRTTVINLTKSFKSFEDGYAELIKIIPEIKTYGGEDVIYEAVIGNIINTIRDNIPSHSSSSYPNTFSLSIDSHEVGIRTDAGMAFGWRTFFDRDSGKVFYKFRVSFITVPAHRKSIIQNMKDNGWEVFETGKQSRFWDKVENRRSSSRPTERNEYQAKELSITAEVKDKTADKEETKCECCCNCSHEENEEAIVIKDKTVDKEVQEEEPKGEINPDIAKQLEGYKFD